MDEPGAEMPPTARAEPPGPAPGAGDDRVLTVPNVITAVRLACLPVFVWLLFGRDNRAAAAALLGVLGATDFLDGYIARHFDQVTRLGKVLDPVADRLLFFVGAGAILIDGSVPVPFAVVVLARESVVAIATVVLASMGVRRIDVTWFGKAGTFALMVAFPLFLAAQSSVGWRDTAEVLAWVAGGIGVPLSYYAAALYVPLARAGLAEARSGRSPASAP